MGVSSLSGIVIPIMVVQTGSKSTIKKITKDLEELQNITSQVNNKFQKLNNTTKQTASVMQNFSKDGELLKSSVKTVSKNIKVTDENLRKYGLTLKDVGANTTHFNVVSNKVVKDSSQWSSFIGKYNDKLNNLRWTMVNVTFALGALAGLAYPFVSLYKAGAEWELQLTRIKMVTEDVYNSSKKMGDLSSFIKNARMDTPFSSVEVATGFLEFAKAGFSAAEAEQAIVDITDLAIAGFTSLEQATKITASTIHAFSGEAMTSKKAVDLISSAANKSALDVDSFGLAMSYAAPIAAALGYESTETAAAIALLSNAGLQSSKAGTTLRQVLNSIANVSPEVEERLANVGVQFAKIDENGKKTTKSLNEVMQQLSKAMSYMDKVQKGKFLADVFNIRGLAGVAVFTNLIEDGGAGIAEMEESLGRVGYASDLAGQAMETNAMKMKNAIQNLKDSMEPLATAFMSSLAPMIDLFGDLAESSNKIAETLKPSTITAVKTGTKIVGGTAVAGGLYGAGRVAVGMIKQRGSSPANPVYVTDVASMAGKTSGALVGSVAGGTGFSVLTSSVKAQTASTKSLTSMLKGVAKGTTTVAAAGVGGGLFAGGIGAISGWATAALAAIGGPVGLALIVASAIGAFIIGKTTSDIGTGKTNGPSPYQEMLKESEEKLIENMGFTINNAIIDVQDGSITAVLKEKIKETTPEEYAEYGEETGVLGPTPIIEGATVSGMNDYQYTGRDLTGEKSGEKYNFLEDYSSIIISSVDDNLKKQFEKITTGLVQGFLDKITDPGIKKFDEIIKHIETEYSKMDTLEASGAVSEELLNRKNKVIDYVNKQKDSYIYLIGTLEEFEGRVEKAEYKVENYTDSLSDANKQLKIYQNELKGVNDIIATLSKPRFGGQLEAEMLISDFDKWEKEQRLAEYGVTAQELLQRAVGMTREEYSQLYFSVADVNNEIASGEDTYNAWRETVMEFIKDSIKAGNELGKNVSGALTKYSTMLLSTSKFASEGTSSQEESVSLLKDAYDVYYGGMVDDVNFAIQAHEEEKDGVYNSTSVIITQLQAQWKEHDRVTQSITDSQKAVDYWAGELDIAKDKLDLYRYVVDETKKSMDKMITSIYKQTAAQLLLNDAQAGSGGISSGNYEEKRKELEERSNVEPYVDTDGKTKWRKKDDFLMRPGQEAVSFSPQDTIIGVKDPSKLGGGSSITIGDIHINGASGDPDEIARKIVDQIRMDTRLG